MKLVWILTAEGFGTDANGAVTAIGINQNIVASEILPATTKRVIIAHFVMDSSESDKLAGHEITVAAQVVSPSGDVIAATTAPAKLPGPAPWPNLPMGLDVVFQLPLQMPSYGRYEVTISTQAPGSDKIQGSEYLYVRDPKERRTTS